jgi:integrase
MAVAELDPSTQNTYEGYIRRTILPALGSRELRKVRGPLLDTFYARLRRCGDLACTGKPFTEHRNFPDLTIEPGDSRSAWRRASAAIRDAVGSGQLAPGEQLPSVRELAAQHGLPVASLRRALEELAREGVIAVLNIKALRHYTASQLLAGGIDLRNTAARLGHGGGATTLRHYADPVSEVDRRAAAYLAQLTAHTGTSRAAPPAGLPSQEG